MASVNKKQSAPVIYTAEGARARRITPTQQLRRLVMSCLLWEDNAYEDGQSVASLIAELVPKVHPVDVCALALEARARMKLRHVPLFLAVEMVKHPTHRGWVAELLEKIIQRPDEITELLALYAKDRPGPKKLNKVANQIVRGIARAFPKFDAYQLAKYNRDTEFKLRDALFLSHPKPKTSAQQEAWNQLTDKTLRPADTWEVALSAGADKKRTFERLICEQNLGALALLRNLRNMQEAGVDENVVLNALLTMDVSRVLPFRFLAAARYAPQWEPVLEQAMFRAVDQQARFRGKTILLVDVSGSMDSSLSSQSEMLRVDAAYGLAILLREVCENISIYTFSSRIVQVPPRRGFALRDVMASSQEHAATYLGTAVSTAMAREGSYDRLIVITDEQSAEEVPSPKGRGYVINVASEVHGVGYGPWTHIDGWSESVVNYISALEAESEAGIYYF